MPINIDLIKNPLNWITVILMLLMSFIIFNLIFKCSSKNFIKGDQTNG